MNNQIYRVHGTPSVLHRSHRKLIWLSLPTLQPIYKYYTHSHYLSTMSSGSIMVIDGTSITFLTVQLPPLILSSFRKQFLEWTPIGGFCLSLMLVLHDKHSITFYDRGFTLRKNWVIEVIQQIKEIKHSIEESVIGMTVKQKLNIIFIWKLGEISSKPFQQVEVAEAIVKWEFHEKQILVILTTTDIQVYSPNTDEYYNMNFYYQLPCAPIDFCFLDRPKTVEHSGRKSVYTVGVLERGKLHIYQLHDIEKRTKNSEAYLLTTLDISPEITKFLCGFQNRDELVFCYQHSSKKPLTHILDSKYQIKAVKQFLPEILCSPQDLSYRKDIICRTSAGDEGYHHTLYRIKQAELYEPICQINSEIKGILGNTGFYAVNADSIRYYPKNPNQPEFDPSCPTLIQTDTSLKKLNLFLLEEIEHSVYFLAGIKVYKLDIEQSTFKAIGFTARNERFKLKQVRTSTRSIVYTLGNDNVLMEYYISPDTGKLTATNVRSTPNQIISLRNGRWAEKTIDRVIVGHQQTVLTSFDMAKFFKALSQENTLFEYKIYWTTHDGIILLVKNYLFILQIVESSEGYFMGPLKKMLTYLHHRFNPDIPDIQVLDPRGYVVREGTRVIKLGSKFGNFVSEDPYSLPDTVLNRQLAMRKHYPPHHPKLVSYLLQMGCFSHLFRMVQQLTRWLNQKQSLGQLYDRIGASFYQAYEEHEDERVVSSIEGEEEEIASIKKLCEKILEDPSALCLQQNGSLILESQFESLIFKDENSRSLDFYSAIVMTQFKTFDFKNRNFDMMHVAYMLHSINKEEAVTLLRQGVEEINWAWMQRFSIVMWYDGKEQLRKWVEQIGMNEFKRDKDPMDCMLWYVLVGKKNLLVTLFKKYQFNSKQHEATFKFLQRDFEDPKNREAASKNGFKLLDSKRYHLSIAFYLLGECYIEALSTCLTRLKDINLALLILTIATNDRTQIAKLLIEEGDVWARHIGHFYLGSHIDSFNCLFETDEPSNLEEWSKEPKLVGFHPSLTQFAEMIEKSIPVKRELEQQKMMSSQSNSTDIFESFYGAPQVQKPAEQKQIKELKADYETLTMQSAEYFVRNNCPLLSLMLDHNNRRALRSYDLSQYVLAKKITPNVAEIAEELEDVLGILESKIQYKLPVRQTIENFGSKMVEALKEVQISVMFQSDRPKIGQLMHYCYLAEQIMQIAYNQLSEDEALREIADEIQVMQTIGKVVLVLELEAFEQIEPIINSLIKYFKKGRMRTQSQIHNEDRLEKLWGVLKNRYAKLLEMKKNKNHQVMDAFEHTFYKYTFQKSEVQGENSSILIGIDKAMAPALKREVVSLIASFLSGEKGLSEPEQKILAYLQVIEKKFHDIFSYWVEPDAKDQINKELGIMYAEGSVSKLKINFLNEFLGEDFDSFCRSLCDLKKLERKNKDSERKLWEGIASLGGKKIQKRPPAMEPFEVFRNRADVPRGLALNKNDGKGLQIVLLQKRNLRKVDVCESLVNRNRSHDGMSLLQDDNFVGLSAFDFDEMLKSSYPPNITEALTQIIENRDEYDGNGIVRGSAKRNSADFMRQLDPLPSLELNEMFSISCHHFLPIFMVGGKERIQLCRFSDLTAYNTIRCPGMVQIVKTTSYEHRVTALDHSGNLGCYVFDSKISGGNAYSLKKSAVVDFCMIKPTILGVVTTNSIQMIDTLLHPKRQCVFKVPTSQAPLAVDYFKDTKLVVCRKNDLTVYDARMDMQDESRDLGGKFRCVESNHQDRVYVGRSDGKVKVFDMNDSGSDRQIRFGRAAQEGDKVGVQAMGMLGKSLAVLNSEGSVFSVSII